jgi:hypothetical protein
MKGAPKMQKQLYQPSFEIVKFVGEEIREIVECQMSHAALNMALRQKKLPFCHRWIKGFKESH